MAQVAGIYKDITLGEYCGWHKAGDNKTLKCAAVTGLTKEQVRGLKLDKVDRAISIFTEALKRPTSKIEYKITIGGVDYGLIPDLTNGSMTMAEHIDLVNNAEPANQYDTLPKMMAILYRPIIAKVGNRYEVEPYDYKKHLANAKQFESVSMETVNGVLLFFSTIAKELQVNSQLYLANQLKKQMEIVKELSKEDIHSPSSDGNIFSFKWLTEFFRRKNTY